MRKIYIILLVFVTSIVHGQPSSMQFGRMMMKKNILDYTLIDSVTINGYNFHTLNMSGSGSTIIFLYSDSIYQYNLTTAFDITPITLSKKIKSYTIPDTIGIGNGSPYLIYIDNSGTRMYIFYDIFGDYYYAVAQLSMSTAYDINTLSYVGRTYYMENTGNTVRYSFSLNNNGTYMYIPYDDYYIKGHKLTTAWDIRTLSKTDTIISPPGKYGEVWNQKLGCRFNTTGQLMYNIWADEINEFILYSPFDITKLNRYKNMEFNPSVAFDYQDIIVCNNDKDMYIMISDFYPTKYTIIYHYKYTKI